MDSEFRNIFPAPCTPQLNDKSGEDRFRFELWEFLSQIGFGSLPFAREFYTSLREQFSKQDWRSTIIDIGEAKYLSINGNTLSAYNNLRDAYRSTFLHSVTCDKSIHKEIQALYIFVWTGLKVKLGMSERNILDLELGQSLTSVSTFKLAFKYAKIKLLVESGNLPPSKLNDIYLELRNNNLVSLSVVALLALGNFYSRSLNSKKAQKCFERTHVQLKQYDLPLLKIQLSNSRAFYHLTRDELFEAEKYLEKTSLKPIFGTTPIILENFALLAEKRGLKAEAIKFVKRALNISLYQDNVLRLPSECMYLGEAYEELNTLDKAEYYYKMGYDNTMRYAAAGITVTGDRKKAVEAYVNFLKRQEKPVGKTQPNTVDTFAFAQGKSWKEIKDTFHHQLILYHSEHLKNARQIAKHLDMPATTLYSLRSKLVNRGYSWDAQALSKGEKEHDLHAFLQSHHELSWEEVNRIFEREMIHYLYEKYGYNKMRMSKVLNLSYTVIIEKTRDLTHAHEHFLPN